jgi:hypothetical protein
MSRLAQLQRGLQRRLNRKPTTIEAAMMDRCAQALLRNELAALSGKTTAADLTRLSRAASATLREFETACGLEPCPRTKTKPRSIVDIEAELAGG